MERIAAGGRPIVEIMIPLTVTREELALARRWTEEAVKEVVGTVSPRGPRAKAPGAHRHDDRDPRARLFEPARSRRRLTSSRSARMISPR